MYIFAQWSTLYPKEFRVSQRVAHRKTERAQTPALCFCFCPHSQLVSTAITPCTKEKVLATVQLYNNTQTPLDSVSFARPFVRFSSFFLTTFHPNSPALLFFLHRLLCPPVCLQGVFIRWAKSGKHATTHYRLGSQQLVLFFFSFFFFSSFCQKSSTVGFWWRAHE